MLGVQTDAKYDGTPCFELLFQVAKLASFLRSPRGLGLRKKVQHHFIFADEIFQANLPTVLIVSYEPGSLTADG